MSNRVFYRRQAVLSSAIAFTVWGSSILTGTAWAATVDAAFSSATLTPLNAIGDTPAITQFAFGPDGRLYVSGNNQPIYSYDYTTTTVGGVTTPVLSDKVNTGIQGGIGIAFNVQTTPDDSTPTAYMYVSHDTPGLFDQAEISRYGNTAPLTNRQWGQGANVNVNIVQGIPVGDHDANQIKIVNNQLFIGIGLREYTGLANGYQLAGIGHDTPAGPVNNGGFYQTAGSTAGYSYGDTSYNGTISTIKDLTQVANTTGSAQLQAGPNGTSGAPLAQYDFLPSNYGGLGVNNPYANLPLTSTATNKLVVLSSGTRNPFGLAFDSSGQLYFTNNFDRANTTGGNGGYTPHLDDANNDGVNNGTFQYAVGDQFFKASPGANYGFINQNFPAANPAITKSITFDNLYSSNPNYLNLQIPSTPQGLGPNASADGVDFLELDLGDSIPGFTAGLKDYALIARYNGPTTDSAGQTLNYQDIVIVDPATGNMAEVATGFDHPLAVLATPDGKGLLIGDFGDGTDDSGQIYYLSLNPNPVLDFIWTGASNGNWDTLGTDLNWTTASAWSNNANRSTPNAATFNLATPATVTVNNNIDVGSITFTTGGWILSSGTGVLAYGATGAINITTTTGTDTINAVITNGSTFGSGGGVTSLTKSGAGTLILGGANTYSGGTTISSGTLVIATAGALPNATAVSNNASLMINANSVAGQITGTGSITVAASTSLSAASIVQSTSLTINGTVTINATPVGAGPGPRNTSATTSVVGSLTIAGGATPTGKLNLNNNALVISNGGAAALNTVEADIAYARDGGAWDRNGITSGNVQAAQAASGFDSLTLGDILNSNLATPYTTFGGQSVSPSDVLVKFTYGGDANLSGTVNGDDYFQIDQGFVNHLTGWINGDFNHDGVVNGDDYFIIDSNFINQSGQLAASEVLTHEAEFGPSYLSDFTPAQLATIGVPEPATLTLLGLAAASLLHRRRNGKRRKTEPVA